MKRSEFFAEMRQSLLTTVKNAYRPFIEEDSEKMEQLADEILGVQWCYQGKVDSLIDGTSLSFKAQEPVIIVKEGENIQAFSGICLECSNLLFISNITSIVKCPCCEKEYHLLEKVGDLQLKKMRVKQRDNKYYTRITNG